MNWTEENGTLVLSGGGWEHIYVLTQDGALEDGNGARLVRSIGQEPRTALMTKLPQGRWELDRVTGADGALSAQGGMALVFESGAAALYLNGGMTDPYPAALEGGRARIGAGSALLYACMRENGAVTIRIGGLEFWFVRAERG